MKLLISLISVLILSGCAYNPGTVSSSNYTPPTYIRDTQGRTVAKIDGSGNIYNTSGVRLGKISKK
jgi:uncharacterized lipoprotein YajG